MVLAMVLDGDGIPVCSEMWPGNITDVTTLDQIAGRLQSRFGVRRVCLVADAGMVSKKMIAAVEAHGWLYILGARLRRTTEVRDVVLSDPGAFETIEVACQRPDPMQLQIKEVTVNDTACKRAVNEAHKPRRYVVCRIPDQVGKDAATREQILAALESKLRSDGPKSVVANKGCKLAGWLHDRGMDHVRGAPYHPMTQGKIERWHQALKNRILLEHYYS